jgi:hypothetical protein
MFKFPKDTTAALLESIEQNNRLMEEIQTLREKLKVAEEAMRFVDDRLVTADLSGVLRNALAKIKEE